MVVYATETKVDPLGVPADLIEREGVVSEAVAAAMASEVAARLGADVGLSLTGVAGPGPAGGIDPGTVVVGVATPDGTTTRTIRLPGDRERVRRYGATAALHQLRRVLEHG
jgi:nicotinamide-nucleotide amidase